MVNDQPHATDNQRDRPQRETSTDTSMNRRKLVIGSAAIAAAVLTSGQAISSSASSGNAGGPVMHAQTGGSFSLVETSVSQIRDALTAGQVTVRAVVQACLDRIAANDREGPTLRAVIETNPDALTIADKLDAELAAGESRGPLHGIPVLLKDNIATVDQMQTTAGSFALEGAIPTHDSFVAQQLRDAGMVILGKANLSEWANIRSVWASSGWSGRGGQAVNPYQLDRTPSGSSSGSAVAVAASYVPLAIGTETNGSLVSPAGRCGIVAIKP
ncbi:MAG TPA: amidase family protein, partial [Thermomicrobiales bacterium]|nr:amidase family protein [Thermomicrobiales bacterium]